MNIRSIRKLLLEINYIVKPDRTKFLFLVFLFFLNSMIEILGLGLLAQFLNILINPSSENKSTYISFISDYLEASTNRELAIKLGLLLIGTYFVKMIMSIFITLRINHFVNYQVSRLRNFLMTQYLNFPYKLFIKKSSSEYVYSVLELTNKFSLQVMKNLLKSVSDILVIALIFGFLILFFGVHLLFIVSLLSIGIIIYFLVFSKIQVKFGKTINIQSGKIIKFVNESVSGFKELKILNLEVFLLNRLKASSDKFAKSSSLAQSITAVPRFLIEFLLVLSILSLILLSLVFYDDYSQIIASIALMGVASIRLLPPLNSLSNTYMVVKLNRDTIERMYKDLNELEKLRFDSLRNEKKYQQFEILEFKNVSFSYLDSDLVLKNVSITIKRGEVVGIVGNSGAGKSTLMDLMIGLLKPTSGHIYLNGEHVQDVEIFSSKNAVYVPQTPFFIEGTIAENIALGKEVNDIDQNKMDYALKLSNFSEVLSRLKLSIKDDVGEHGLGLSGGEKQRLILARAIYLDRNLIFLDEPTSALDKEGEDRVLKELSSLKMSKTLIIISHKTEIGDICDKVYSVVNGQIKKVKG